MTALICKTCKKVYHRPPSSAKSSNYCSNSCRAKSMSKVFLKDLTGKKFGRWTVLRQSTNGKSGDVRWLCRCSCGTKRVIYGNSLKSGRSSSCGCYHKEVSARQASELFSKPIAPGTRFTRLVVIKKGSGSGSRGVYYICQCDCGEIRSISSGDLRSGNTNSCGCYQKDKASEASITHGLSSNPHYRRHLKHRRAELDKDWTYEMEIALRKFFPVCVVCGSDFCLSTDHVLPFSKGFGLSPGNAVVLCKSCNSTKHDKEPHELPKEWQKKILAAANQFQEYWDGL